MKTKYLSIWDINRLFTESESLKELFNIFFFQEILNYIKYGIKVKIDILEIKAGQTKGQNAIKEVTACKYRSIFCIDAKIKKEVRLNKTNFAKCKNAYI